MQELPRESELTGHAQADHMQCGCEPTAHNAIIHERHRVAAVANAIQAIVRCALIEGFVLVLRSKVLGLTVVATAAGGELSEAETEFMQRVIDSANKDGSPMPDLVVFGEDGMPGVASESGDIPQGVIGHG